MRVLLCLMALVLPGLQATAATVRVNWQPVDRDVEGGEETVGHYLVYLGRQARPATVHHPADGTFSYQRVINAGSKTQLTIPDLAEGETWYLSTAAVDNEGNVSDYSKEVRIEIPGPEGKDSVGKSAGPTPTAADRKSNSGRKPAAMSGGCESSGRGPGQSALGLALAAGLLAFRRRGLMPL